MIFASVRRTPSSPSYRATATLHRSAPQGPSRRRRLGLAALGGGAAVAATSGLAAVLATGAYASPQAALPAPSTTAGAYLTNATTHESQLSLATHAEVAAVQRAAARARSAQAASRSETRAPLESSASFSGLASWYGPGFEGRPTASGAPYDENALTAASRTLPLGTHLQVCHDGRCVTVLINDWGPVPRTRILDLSRAAALDIGIYEEGVGEVTATPVG